MKLRQVEKVLIIVLVIVAVLGVGYFFFIDPNMKATEALELEIADYAGKIENAKLALLQEEELNKQYEIARQGPIEVQELFYAEMHSTEAEKTISEIIKNSGHKSISGISISAIEPIRLTVNLPSEAADVNYELRQFAFLQEVTASTTPAEDTAVVDPSQTGGNQQALLESGEIITLKDALEYLTTERDEENRRNMANVIRGMLSNQSAEIAVIKGTFSLSLTNSEYNQFLKYIRGLPKATGLTSAVFKNPNQNTMDKEEYDFSINLYVIREMDMVDISLLS